MEQMLKIMFSDNPNLPEELYTFCNSIPNYVRAEREYLQIARQVADRLGYDLYNEFEEKLNDYMAQQLDACYLFGLGLRRELRPSTPTPAVRTRKSRMTAASLRRYFS